MKWLPQPERKWLPQPERLKRLLKRSWPSLLILVGVLLLVYVAAQYTEMYAEQRRLVHEWEQQTFLARHNPAAVTTLTRLSIPSIKLDAVLVEGTNRKALLLGPGHLKETPQPGESGNSIVTGHRDTFFRHIYELNRGDDILVQRNGKEYHYEVTGKKIVKPDDMSVLKATKSTQLTLITCYPTYYIGPAPERLVVFSRLSPSRGTPAGGTSAAAQNNSHVGNVQ